jgi:hypothetical protein
VAPTSSGGGALGLVVVPPEVVVVGAGVHRRSRSRRRSGVLGSPASLRQFRTCRPFWTVTSGALALADALAVGPVVALPGVDGAGHGLARGGRRLNPKVAASDTWVTRTKAPPVIAAARTARTRLFRYRGGELVCADLWGMTDTFLLFVGRAGCGVAGRAVRPARCNRGLVIRNLTRHCTPSN